MANWKLSTQIKKCVHEEQIFEKDGSDEQITVSWQWRWGSIQFTTPDDDEPVIDLSDGSQIDVLCLPYEDLDHSLDDGYVYDTDFPDSMSQEDIDLFHEDMFEWLDNNGWECLDAEIIFDGPLTLERI